MEESIVERVLVLIKDYGLTASEFADKIDVQRSSMSHLVSGRNKPSLDFIQKILNNFSDINPTWLIMGTGPMKQLDLFDIKGDVAPAEPIQAKKLHSAEAVALKDIVEQTTIKQSFDETEPIVIDPAKVVYDQTTSAPAAMQEPIIQVQPIVREEVPVQPPVSVAPIALVSPIAVQTPPVPATTQAPTENTVSKIAAETTGFVEKSVQNDKKVIKIVFFYSDNTFETYNPQ